MALRRILTKEEPGLRKKSREVVDFNQRLWTLIDDMIDTMAVGEGVGLAAPQVGVLRRCVIVDVGEGMHELINPEIVKSEGDQCGGEGCLSIPNEWGLVHRPEKLAVKARDRFGKPFTLDAEGYFAVAICHELDHLDGILFIDRAERMLTEDEIEHI